MSHLFAFAVRMSAQFNRLSSLTRAFLAISWLLATSVQTVPTSLLAENTTESDSALHV